MVKWTRKKHTATIVMTRITDDVGPGQGKVNIRSKI